MRRTGSWGILVDCAEREVAKRSKRLWIAVLHQAIEDANGRTRSAEKSASTIGDVQRDALIWIFHDQSTAGNSFHTICDILDLDPDQARQRLRRVPAIRRGLHRTRLDVGQGEG
ncbi:hypothetical protein [Candidatus Accumulibacter sp. ACC003]|uniref:hypothetical protein n=1 Tax=Candidatus Accumulibacter sp. ACC003 TaxID=2823334 RepID=UPI0025C1CCD3|nr:hypothetical protein [Candidatus Accumulibacter sp. ACC003]